MVSLEKIAHLVDECRFDSLGPKMGLTMGLDINKLEVLGAGTRLDACASTFSPRSPGLPGICHAFSHDGRCVSLFKTLYTNHCTHQCSYCTNAVGCTHKNRTFSYTPEELVRITLALYRSNYIEGLFLSSGSGGDEDRTMERMVETARLLRLKCGFQGYIHLKVLPGASKSLIHDAVELADRVSINLEAASTSHMGEICPTKNYESDILQRQRYIRDAAQKVNLPAGQTTQLVVGAAGESDLEIFKRVLYEYNEIGVRRAYYSAFSPQKGTPFEARTQQPLWREHRLYQTDWLYRVYRFPPEEIRCAFDENGFLPDVDPKMAVAMKTLCSPVDPNLASYSELLRVPGIGPASARRIMDLRQRRRITKKEDLARLGVRVRRASAFLKINGWRDSTLEMWSA